MEGASELLRLSKPSNRAPMLSSCKRARLCRAHKYHKENTAGILEYVECPTLYLLWGTGSLQKSQGWWDSVVTYLITGTPYSGPMHGRIFCSSEIFFFCQKYWEKFWIMFMCFIHKVRFYLNKNWIRVPYLQALAGVTLKVSMTLGHPPTNKRVMLSPPK